VSCTEDVSVSMPSPTLQPTFDLLQLTIIEQRCTDWNDPEARTVVIRGEVR
jgi:hypothetical protein